MSWIKMTLQRIHSLIPVLKAVPRYCTITVFPTQIPILPLHLTSFGVLRLYSVFSLLQYTAG